jgi:hypothetical protein
MGSVASAVDVHLMALDPVRGLLAVSTELDRLKELDGRVREACTLVEDRLSALSVEDRDETLAPLAWLGLRERLGPDAVAAVRRSLNDGAGLLHAVDGSLATTLDTEVLQSVVAQAKDVDGGRLQEARDELTRARTGADSPIIVIVVVVIIVVVVLALSEAGLI